jgi:hypothetical protein
MTSAGARPVLPNFYYRFDSGHSNRIMREVRGFLPIICFRFDSVFGAAVDRALAHMQRFCVQSWTQKNLLV